jgi:hypothetical protein
MLCQEEAKNIAAVQRRYGYAPEPAGPKAVASTTPTARVVPGKLR